MVSDVGGALGSALPLASTPPASWAGGLASSQAPWRRAAGAACKSRGGIDTLAQIIGK